MLYNEDCLTVLPTIAAESIDAIICDLPYGTTRNRWDSVIPIDQLWREYRRIIKPNGVIALTAQQPFSTALAYPALDILRYDLVWKKTQPTGFLNSKRAPLKSHEQVLIFYKHQSTYNAQKTTGHKPYTAKRSTSSTNYARYEVVETVSEGERFPTSVLEFPRDKDAFHPTQKPLALMEWWSKPIPIPVTSCSTTAWEAERLESLP